MNIFSRPEYRSDFTLFVGELQQKQPGIVEQQRAGLALLWDKTPVDLVDHQRTRESQIKRNAYVYE